MTAFTLHLVKGFDPDQPLTDWLPLLPPSERERAARYRFAEDQWRFVIGRLMIRGVMAQYADCSPCDLPLATNRYDRPLVMNLAQPQFSLAHSGRVVALLVGQGACGVDVECIRARRMSASLYRRIVGRDDEPRDIDLFYRYWTRKEAVMKAHGLGLSLAPERIPVDFGSADHGVVHVTGLDLPLWVSDLNVLPGYAMAVALEGVTPSACDVRFPSLGELRSLWP